jgi:hypothetical protein
MTVAPTIPCNINVLTDFRPLLSADVGAEKPRAEWARPKEVLSRAARLVETWPAGLPVPNPIVPDLVGRPLAR